MVANRNLCKSMLFIALCLMLLTAGHAAAVDSDGDLFDDDYETSMGTDPFNLSSYPSIPVTGFVQHVVEADETSRTYFEVVIEEGFLGTLPGPISIEITRTDPDGSTSVIPLPAYEYLSQWRDFFWDLPGEPDLGVYTFNVTYNTYSGSDVDYQYTIRYLPGPAAGSFLPADGQTITSSTPSFSWDAIDYSPPAGEPNPSIYYRLELNTGPGSGRVFASPYVYDMTSYTLPAGVLTAGETYYWRVRFVDGAGWPNYMNRRNGQWRAFTMATTLTHAAVPAIDPDGWGVVNYNRPPPEGAGTSLWVRIYDHDGVASDGSSHAVTAQLLGDPTEYPMTFIRSYGNYSAGYEFWDGGNPPPPGAYILKVVDPDGRTGTFTETVTAQDLAALPPVDENTITPSVKDEQIRVKYDNIYINNETDIYENFNSYNTIEDLDFSNWHWYQNASIERDNGDGWLILDIGNSVGRATGVLSFQNPDSITSIQADVSIENNVGLNTRAELRGLWCHNGIGDVSAKLYIIGDTVHYNVSQEYINEHDTYQWDSLADEEILTGLVPGQTVTLGIEWIENTSTLRFAVNGMPSDYVVAGALGPPQLDNSKQLRARINLTFDDTTPTFYWDEVAGANRYRIRIYNYDDNNRHEIWRDTSGATGTGQVSITVPPGVLLPNSYYRYRIEAWDSHSPLNKNSISRIPTYGWEYYQFYTGSVVDDHPFIDLRDIGVSVWNDELLEPFLVFFVEVYDADGVPDDIASVQVTLPISGDTISLDYRPDMTCCPPTATSAIYYTRSSHPIEEGIYTFTVSDTAGNTYPIDEDLTSDAIGYPAEASLRPLDGANIGSTAVHFDWEDVEDAPGVPAAAFYWVQIYDHDFNRIYTYGTTTSELHLAAGLLKENTLYRWRVQPRREFFSENVDNGSSAPADFFSMPTFVTTPLTDSEPDGLPDDWENEHGLNTNKNDAGDDADGDGLTNLEEYQRATDPNNSDTDNDGIPDGVDPFPVSAYESSDSDGDGIEDNTDACPYDPNDDSDSDGVCGDIDNCPGDPNGDQVDLDGNEWGDVCDDIDGDLANDNVDPWPIDPDNDIDGDGYGADPFENCLNIDPNLTELAAICQAVDNCPGIANDQTDSDDDGIGDACDLAVGGAPPACHPVKNPCDPPIDDTAAEDDADGDAIPDAEDLCPNLHIDDDPNDSVEDPLTGSINHLNTDGDGDGDACDNDDDNDGVADASDNCPLVHNTGQNNLDCDNQGDLCDPDRDGDGYTDSDEISTYGTLPDNADTDGDGWSDGDQIPIDCNNIYDPQITQANDPAPLGEPPQYSISIEVLNLAGADIRSTWLPTPEWNEGLAEWMPENIRIRATLQDENGNATPLNGDMTFEILDSTNHEGVAANDEEENSGEPLGDFSFNPTVSGDITDTLQTINTNGETEIELDLHVFDFGGRATVKVSTSTQDGDLVVGQIKIPLDSDSDNLPDRWEQMHGFDPFNANSYSVEKIDGDADIDVSANNSHKGDGLPNFREYRGIILDVVNANGKIHQRLDPLKKDLFVRGDNFFNSIPSNTSPGVLPFSVDHTGIYGIPSAFEEAGIVVHDVTGMPSFVDEADSLWEPPHIDVLVVTNKTQPRDDGLIDTLTGLENGFINHPSSLIPRYWTWDLKGASYIGNVQFYAIFHDEATGVTKRGTETYHLTLMHYFHNRPYWEDSNNASLCNEGYLNMLDPLHNVEDYYKENGIDPPDSKGKNKEDRCVAENGVLDGDRMIPTWKTELWGIDNYEAGFQYSTFDADGDGRVENPIFDDAEFLDPNEWDAGEYTATQVQLHTILHEMGHAVGMDEQHTSDPEDLMFEESINWSRAGHFSPYSQSQILIHNKTELQ